jgi:hypothetical protein
MAASELIVTVRNENVIEARLDGGNQKVGKVDDHPLHWALIDFFEQRIVKGEGLDKLELRLFGSLLYNALFEGAIDSLFRQAYDAVCKLEKPDERRLRVQLSFEKAAKELQSRPWEYLHFPDSPDERRLGFFLATETQLVLSRYEPLAADRPQTLLPEKAPLRILIVVSQPARMPPVSADKVIEQIKKLEENNPVVTKTLDNPTYRNFLNSLDTAFDPENPESGPPHIVHLIGHGHVDEVALLEPTGKVKWCPDREFAAWFAARPHKPRLVFLQMCESAASDPRASFAGLAPKLVQAGVPAVVAMQHPISNGAAIAFGREFYAALANGKEVDVAVQAGRLKINEEDMFSVRVFGTPVLHLYSREGIIMPSQSAGGGETPPVASNPDVGPRQRGQTRDTTITVAAGPSHLEAAKPSRDVASIGSGPPQPDRGTRGGPDLASVIVARVVIDHGRNKINELDLTDEQRLQLESDLDSLGQELAGMNVHEMSFQLYRRLRTTEDKALKTVIESMFDSIEARP